MDRNELIKVNLPADMESYRHGFGEGVWVLVDAKTKAAHDSDTQGGLYEGVLDNDSYYWTGLEHGAVIPFEMRGDRRPVVPFDWLEEHYTLNKHFFGIE